MTNYLDANDMLDKVLHVIAHAEANPLNDKKDQSIVISLLLWYGRYTRIMCV